MIQSGLVDQHVATALVLLDTIGQRDCRGRIGEIQRAILDGDRSVGGLDTKIGASA